MFHGPGLGGVGLGIDGSGGILIEQNDGNIAPAQFVGQHEAGRAAADNDDIGIEHFYI